MGACDVRMAAIALLALGGCSGSKQPDTNIDMTILQSKVDALDSRLERIEGRQPLDYVTFQSPKDGWQWLASEASAIRINLHELRAGGNGSVATLAILNPLAVELADCSIKASWGETDSAGAFLSATGRSDVMRIEEPLLSGEFVFPTFNLADIKPDKLGRLTLSEFHCLRLRKVD